MAEQRREHRLKANIPIKIVFSKDQELITQTMNLSRLGTYLETDRQIPVGSEVELVLELPAYVSDIELAGEVRCKGSVFRSQPVHQTPSGQFWGEGIFFTEFFGPGKEKLSRYIDYLIEKEEQMVKDGMRRRKDKEQAATAVKLSQDFASQEYDFQKEVLSQLKDISDKVQEILRKLKS